MTHTITTALLVRLVAADATIDATHQNAASAFVDGLVDAGICTDTTWGPFEYIHIYATQSAALSVVEWANNHSNGSQINSPTFTADQGYTNANGTAFGTSWIPSSGSVTFARNDAMIGQYIRNNRTSATSGSGYGVYDGTNDTEITPWYTGNVIYVPLNGTGAGDGTASVVWGNWIANRTSSSLNTIYHNGTSFTSDSETSQPLATKEITGVGFNNNGSSVTGSGDQIAASYAGSHLTGAQIIAFDALLNSYMIAVGASVYSNPATDTLWTQSCM